MGYESISQFELEFIIIGAKFIIEFEEGFFDDDEKEDLTQYIEMLSKEISIDRSYVECKHNNRKSTFMVEEGWNSLRDLLIDTEYGKYIHPKNQSFLADALATMAKCYLYECLELKTDRFAHVNIIIEDDPFDVIICKDKSNDWKNYKGKWQDWKFDDDGNYIGNKSKSNKKDK